MAEQHQLQYTNNSVILVMSISDRRTHINIALCPSHLFRPFYHSSSLGRLASIDLHYKVHVTTVVVVVVEGMTTGHDGSSLGCARRHARPIKADFNGSATSSS